MAKEILVICVCMARMEILKGIAKTIKKNSKNHKAGYGYLTNPSFFSFLFNLITEALNPGEQKRLAN